MSSPVQNTTTVQTPLKTPKETMADMPSFKIHTFTTQALRDGINQYFLVQAKLGNIIVSDGKDGINILTPEQFAQLVAKK